VDAGIGLGFDVNQPFVRSVKGNDGMLTPIVAEQDKGAPQTLGLSVVIHLGGEVAALILIKDKLIATREVFENKIPELLMLDAGTGLVAPLIWSVSRGILASQAVSSNMASKTKISFFLTHTA